MDRQNPDLKDAEQFLKEWQKVIAKRLSEKDRELSKKSKILRNEEFKQMRKDNVTIWHGEFAGKSLADILEKDLMENELSVSNL